jgi:hypothetical protein
MRRSCALALLMLFLWSGGLGQDARAGVTFEVVFQDGPGNALTITEGDAGPGCSFGYYGGSVDTGRCMDVILRTTWPGVFASTSVTYESDDGLALAAMYEWKGVGVSFNKAAVPPVQSCLPFGGLSDNGGVIWEFDCFIAPPNNPPVLPAGTYRVGTIVWDTSEATPGTETIGPVMAGFGEADPPDICIPEGCEPIALNAVLNIIPEVAAVPSMGATGLALLGVAVFGSGVAGLVIAARRRRG